MTLWRRREQEKGHMVAISGRPRIAAIAEDLFEVVTHLCLATPRNRRRRTNDLKEVEFLTLAILNDRGTAIVGDLQRLLGVLPAQMSRIIRALESRPSPLVACRINSRDKRKIDVCLTEYGAKAFRDYQAVRVRRIVELLQDLPEEDQAELTGLLDKVRGLLERGANR
jgi:DNA-binding MarR family transcriptional regulator